MSDMDADVDGTIYASDLSEQFPVHVHEWTNWQPSPTSAAAGVAREYRQCLTCLLAVDRPVATVVAVPSGQDTAAGRCQTVIQCHRETGHQGGHEARSANG